MRRCVLFGVRGSVSVVLVAGLVGSVAAVGDGVAASFDAGWAGGGVTRRVSVGPGGAQANSDSFEPAVSAGGRYVAFNSDASNLVAGDTNDATGRVRAGPQDPRDPAGVGGSGRRAGQQLSFAPAISAHGRYVAFTSAASNLVAGDTNNAATCSCGTARHT